MLNGASGRPLTWRERLGVWRQAVQAEQMSSARGLVLLATPAVGAACWSVGYLGARLAPHERS